MIDRIISWLYTRFLYGKRCSTFVEECPVCSAWAEHDELFAIFHELEWVKHSSGRWEFGDYSVLPMDGGGYGVIGNPLGDEYIFETLEEAKAAVDADYIKSAKDC